MKITTTIDDGKANGVLSDKEILRIADKYVPEHLKGLGVIVKKNMSIDSDDVTTQDVDVKMGTVLVSIQNKTAT